MSNVIKPTIGRKLWYYPSDYDRGLLLELEHKPAGVIEVLDEIQPCDADVCYVHGDRLVNLVVHDHFGRAYARTSVTLLQPGDTVPNGGGYATWMPYQIEAALRHAKPLPTPMVDPLSDTVDLVK